MMPTQGAACTFNWRYLTMFKDIGRKRAAAAEPCCRGCCWTPMIVLSEVTSAAGVVLVGDHV
jgi:hypothetical protein